MQAHRLIYKEFYFSFCPFVTKERNVIFDGRSDFVIFSWGVEEEGGLVFDCSCCFGLGLGYLFLCVLGGRGEGGVVDMNLKDPDLVECLLFMAPISLKSFKAISYRISFYLLALLLFI